MLPLILDSRSFSNNPLVSNLPPITSASTGQPILSSQWLRASFTTGSNSLQYLLSSVSLRTAQISLSPNLFVDLHVDSSGSLGSRLARFTNPSSIPGSTNNNLFTLTTPLLLPANTVYWLVAGILSGSGQYLWAIADSTAESGITGWSISNDSLFSSNQGGTWNSFTTSRVFQFSINGESY